MCLINFHLHDHPNYKLIVAANRDEVYDRPTAPVHFWDDKLNILAGRDLKQMGTWLGITRQGRFAALTNFRDPAQTNPDKVTRGEIVTNYLTSNQSPQEFLTTIHQNRHNYTGFNVLVGNEEQLFHYNNIEMKISKVPNGTHGLSNHMLNTPWPKVTKGKKKLREYVMKNKVVKADDLLSILSNDVQAKDGLLPNTGVGIQFERRLSPLFIKTPNYGTRCSTVLLIDIDNRVTFVERTFKKGKFIKDKQFSFQIESIS